MQEIPLTPTSQTARAHSSSLSERVSDTHTVPPDIPHSTDHTNWAMSWNTHPPRPECRERDQTALRDTSNHYYRGRLVQIKL